MLVLHGAPHPPPSPSHVCCFKPNSTQIDHLTILGSELETLYKTCHRLFNFLQPMYSFVHSNIKMQSVMGFRDSYDLLGGNLLVFPIQSNSVQRTGNMNTGGADKKRIREEQEMSLSEDSCSQKQARLVEFETGMGFDNPENAGAGNENLPEFCSLSKEYSMLLKDPLSWEDSAGFGVRSIAAIRKQSYMLDYLHDSAVVKSTEEEIAEQQVEEEDCLRGSLFEATDDLLWRPQSPLSGTEVLFSLDSFGSRVCTTLLQDENIAQSASSCFRIWEQDDDLKDDKSHADSISYENESRDSDWIWGIHSNQSQFSESVEFETSMPSM